MGKFNTPATTASTAANHPTATTNPEGGLAFKLSPQMELYSRVATSLVGETAFYESAKTRDARLIELIRLVAEDEPAFLLQLAVYTREQLYLRSVTTVLLAEFANSSAAGMVPGARKLVARAIKRPDDMTELIAYQLALNKRTGRKSKLPEVLKRGIAEAFPKFDSYQLAKYDRVGAVKLRDVMFLTHPKPRPADPTPLGEGRGEPVTQADVWKRLIDGTLAPPDTWEVARSTGKMTWPEVVRNIWLKDGRAQNVFAVLRNLRNVISSEECDASVVADLGRILADVDAIRRSKILPFRFLTAYAELRAQHFHGKDITPVYEGLEIAADAATSSMPTLPGKTIIAVDTSGSMRESPIAEKSAVYPVHIAALMGLMARRICEQSMVCTFDNKVTWQNFPDKGILRNAYDMPAPGGATYGHLVVNDLIERKVVVDRFIFLTDMVLYSNRYDGSTMAGAWLKYRSSIAPRARLYNLNLMSYGKSSVIEGEHGAKMIAGWSDRVIEMIAKIEQGGDVLGAIRAITP